MSLPFDMSDAIWERPRAGMSGRRVSGRYLLFRHGESTSNKLLMESGAVALEKFPALTDLGNRQACDIMRHIEYVSNGEPVFSIECSPQARAWETARPSLPMANQASISVKYNLREFYTGESYNVPWNVAFDACNTTMPKVETDSSGSSWVREHETRESFSARIASVVEEWRLSCSIDKRKCVVVFAHSQVINEILKGGTNPADFHLSNGSLSVIDFDETGQMHIHASNLTHHLQQVSGCHTIHNHPFTHYSPIEESESQQHK
jgi:broad specificity phosphatase PhoE